MLNFKSFTENLGTTLSANTKDHRPIRRSRVDTALHSDTRLPAPSDWRGRFGFDSRRSLHMPQPYQSSGASLERN